MWITYGADTGEGWLVYPHHNEIDQQFRWQIYTALAWNRFTWNQRWSHLPQSNEICIGTFLISSVKSRPWVACSSIEAEICTYDCWVPSVFLPLAMARVRISTDFNWYGPKAISANISRVSRVSGSKYASIGLVRWSHVARNGQTEHERDVWEGCRHSWYSQQGAMYLI